MITSGNGQVNFLLNIRCHLFIMQFRRDRYVVDSGLIPLWGAESVTFALVMFRKGGRCKEFMLEEPFMKNLASLVLGDRVQISNRLCWYLT